jgi:hypothetical protein
MVHFFQNSQLNNGGFGYIWYTLSGGIKYSQIHHYLIDWFEKIHPFLNMLIIHLTPFGAYLCKKTFLEKWLVSDGGFPIFDTPYYEAHTQTKIETHYLSSIWLHWP